MYNSYEGMDLSGTVLRIEKSSIYDGDGLRTVVFLKGCPLRCQWCSTPESHLKKIQTIPEESITYGKIMMVEDVMVEIRKDSLFYFHSGGGVTLSGGEIFSQPEFTYNIIRRCCQEGIDTCFETSFLASWEHIEPVLGCTNTAFVDQKLMNDEKHRRYTGVSNELILENIRKAGTENNGYKLIIRRPLIPGVNDSQEDLEALGSFLGDLPGVDHLQLLPYHRLGTDTYRKLGMPYLLSDVEIPTEEHMQWCREITGKYIRTE